MRRVDEVLMIINPLPDLRVLEVGCGNGSVTVPLSKHLEASGGVIDLFEYAVSAPDTVTALPNVTLKLLGDDAQTIRVASREYEAAVITDVMSRVRDPKALLAACFHALENSATLIVLCREGVDDEAAIKELLDATQYVAVNRIDMAEDAYMITAKKMHNWGHGL